MPGIAAYLAALVVLVWAAFWAWMAYWIVRNLRIAVRRGKSASYIAAWIAALVPPAAMTAGLVYLAWHALTAVERYGEHL
jgi:hypothetical protein